MPIGIVSDDDFNKELEHLSGTTKPGGSVVIEKKKGRAEGETNVPDSLRKIIGEESVINGRASAVELASALGISPSSVSAYAHGATSTASYNEPKQSIIEHINKGRRRGIARATTVMNAAMRAITQEKLDYTDADKLSGIAKDMSAIIKNLEPKQPEGGEGGKSTPQFVVFAPQFRDERTFESITIQE